MRRSIKRRHRNYLIMGLCSILLIMGVGYAAFSSKLDISGTSSITSIWDVEITNVVEKEKVGNANTVGLPTWDKTNANIKTTFEAPGDSITYDITVSNLGTLNAVLDSIKINMNDQDIIFFRVTGITSGEVLNAHDDITFELEMTYNENITSQPSETSVDFSMDMNYLQDGNSSNFSDADSDTSNTLSINNINITPTENSAKVEVSASNAIKYYYSIDNNKWYETVEDIYNIYDLKPNMEYTMYIKAEDINGEVIFSSKDFKTLDNTNPEVEITLGDHVKGNNGWYKGVTLNINTSDNDKVANVKYCI